MSKALLIVDMQRMMQHRVDSGWECVHPDAADRVAELAARFRRSGWPVVHVRHREDDGASPLHPHAAGYPPIASVAETGDEPVFVKTTSSAFASTGLEAYLRDAGITDLLVAGAVAGFCVNSTVRAGADLGFRMTVVRDAVLGFALPAAGLSAATIFAVTMAHLAADFATVIDTAALTTD